MVLLDPSASGQTLMYKHFTSSTDYYFAAVPIKNQIHLSSEVWQSLTTVGFWCQGIHIKLLWRFDTSFGIEIMMKIYAIEIIFKSHEPFQSYQLTGPANSARKAG